MRNQNRPFSQVLEQLRSVNLRPTRQRMALAKLLFENPDRHITAEMLLKKLWKKASVSLWRQFTIPCISLPRLDCSVKLLWIPVLPILTPICPVTIITLMKPPVFWKMFLKIRFRSQDTFRFLRAKN